LVKGAIKIFKEYCERQDIKLDDRNFTIRYQSDIPYGLGLAGSSAIITACMKALMNFYGISIPKPILANIILSVENDELKISAGLQDRVAQAYETPVFMDFSKEFMDSQGYGHYVPIPAELFPELYIAYRTDLAESSDVVHNNFRERYHFNDKQVLDAIKQWSELTLQAKMILEKGQKDKLAQLMNKNFDIRKSVMNLSKKNIEMVELARSVGASAKFTGSGGAVIGTYNDEKMYDKLKILMNKHHFEILKPQIVSTSEN
jgi:glucuronokinase